MNVHHLELFYYVAKHCGVSAAARHIPYGIQQPAISAQIIQLEDSLGTTLYNRRPFELTAKGRDLFEFIRPFFGGLGEVGVRMRGGREVRLRIGAPEAIQHNYLPDVLVSLRRRFPELGFTMITGRQDDFERRLLAQEIDIAFTAVHGKPAPGIRHQELLRVPLALLVRKDSRVTCADDLLKMDRIKEPLITVHAEEPVCIIFNQELQRRKVDWFASLELNSFDLVCRYVLGGFGVGLTLLSDEPPPVGTRCVALPDFPTLPFAALWTGNLSPLLQALMKEALRTADGMNVKGTRVLKKGR